ncbi:NAD(P)-dependent oxidoreductase [Alkalibacter mobilis]|uniref:NAD(P)-dependent oxidoreductase n=1 Tax=Alkalibacter mobilis TaxID=2787712 RepID=UPI00189FBFDB|nr:NAD(P)-dependent oxidoreductase [Alkalibacter mobilis]MBF7097067.1 NAD(P)-dependent oxidoreductase [Alkalibacter mobilis]
MPLHVIDEAKRCLQCKKPLCVEGCPVNTPIPEMISLLLDRKINESGEMLFKNNPMSLVCSLICDHERQCEGHCILNKKGTPIHVSSIENFISENYFDKVKLNPGERLGKKVAIIGSGPAGLTISIILAQKGYDVTVFEAREKIGGVLRYGIPEFRLSKKILDQLYEKMQDMGIKIRPNTSIGEGMSVDNLFRDGYSSVFIGTGVWKPNTLNIKGETLGHVHYAIDYLTNPDVYNLGDKVLVIGAGNAAMDVARTALRKGAREVTVFARRDVASASKKEMDYASIEGVEFIYNRTPREITDEGVWFMDTNTEEKIFHPCDSIIIAVSQGPRSRIVSSTSGLDVDKKGLVVVNENGETTRKGVYASGDVVLGAKTVVEAVYYSKKVATAMDQYMKGI